MNNLFRTLGFLTILYLISACAAKPIIEPTNYSPNQFWSDQTLREKSLKKILGKFKLYYNWEGDSVSGNGSMIAKMPNQLRLEARDLLGRVQYIVVLKKKKLTAYYPSQKVAYYDNHSGSVYLKKVMGTSFTFADFQLLLMGVLPNNMKKPKFDEWAWDAGRGAYEGVLGFKDKVLAIYVDPKFNSIKEISVESKEYDMKIEYEDFKECCAGKKEGFNVAQMVAMMSENPKAEIEVNWKELKQKSKLNAKAFILKLPKGVRTVHLKKED